MNNLNKTRRIALEVVSAVFAICAAQSAVASDASVSSAEQHYKQERAACMDGRSSQDRQTCLKEASNALAEARKNPSPTSSKSELRSNALARCQNVLESDKAACKRLALGKGTQSGSVEGGGVIKEEVTTTTSPPIVVVPAQK